MQNFMEKYKEYLFKKWYDDFEEGTHILYKFPNNYGASVIQTRFSRGGNWGLWEIAVIFFDGDDYELTYSTPITGDTLGCLTDENVCEILEKIKNL